MNLTAPDYPLNQNFTLTLNSSAPIAIDAAVEIGLLGMNLSGLSSINGVQLSPTSNDTLAVSLQLGELVLSASYFFNASFAGSINDRLLYSKGVLALRLADVSLWVSAFVDINDTIAEV